MFARRLLSLSSLPSARHSTRLPHRQTASALAARPINWTLACRLSTAAPQPPPPPHDMPKDKKTPNGGDKRPRRFGARHWTMVALAGGLAVLMSGRLSPSPVRVETRMPQHPSRHYSTSSVDAILRENQYTLSSLLGRVDVVTLASNDPIEDRHSAHVFRVAMGDTLRDVMMLGVYDGHAGHECAEVLRHELPHYAARTLAAAKSVPEGLKTAFAAMDEDLRRVAEDPALVKANPDNVLPAISGAVTILACLVGKDLYVANAGDVRAVLGRRVKNHFSAVELSHDHDAENPSERARMLREHPKENEATLLKHDRVLGGLQPLRAFGDNRYKWSVETMKAIEDRVPSSTSGEYRRLKPPSNYLTPPYVTAEPEIMQHTVDGKDDTFVIIATDGLWDRVNNEEAVEHVGEYIRQHGSRKNMTSADNAATSLLRFALEKGAKTDADKPKLVEQILAIPPPYSRRYRDDITITILFLDSKLTQNCWHVNEAKALNTESGVDQTTYYQKVQAKTPSKAKL